MYEDCREQDNSKTMQNLDILGNLKTLSGKKGTYGHPNEQNGTK